MRTGEPPTYCGTAHATLAVDLDMALNLDEAVRSTETGELVQLITDCIRDHVDYMQLRGKIRREALQVMTSRQWSNLVKGLVDQPS